MQKKSGENDTDIAQEQVDYFTDGMMEISTILYGLRNITCNGTVLNPDASNLDDVTPALRRQYGELRMH